MDYSSLLGFPIEVVIVAIICFTLVEIVKIWKARDK